MQRLAAILAILMLAAGLAGAQAQVYTPEELLRELDTVRVSLRQNGISASDKLPDVWHVKTSEREFTISTKPLRDRPEGDTVADQVRVNDAIQWVSELERQIRSYGAQDGQAYKDPRKSLTDILSRPEFAEAAPPNAWNRFVQSLYATIIRWLDRLFQFAAQHPAESKVLFWTVLIGAILALGTWVLRMFEPQIPPPSGLNVWSPPVPIRPWQEWLALARAATEQGDHKEAIRCGYWAGVMRLQETGALPVEWTNTPRERLRLLQRLHHREAFAAVTNALERYWYAGQATTEDDVRRVFQQLEAIECKAA